MAKGGSHRGCIGGYLNAQVNILPCSNRKNEKEKNRGITNNNVQSKEMENGDHEMKWNGCWVLHIVCGVWQGMVKGYHEQPAYLTSHRVSWNRHSACNVYIAFCMGYASIAKIQSISLDQVMCEKYKKDRRACTMLV